MRHPNGTAERSSWDPIPPFIRWPGGKRAIAATIRRLLPKQFGHYYEPFLGGGALFFSLGGLPAVLADRNPDLIECYHEVQSDVDNVIDVLTSLTNSKAEYYRLRAWSPKTSVERAARLVYLVNLSFNGIYRVNFANGFNVPYGHRPHRPTCEPEALRLASSALQQASILQADFEDAVVDARPGDLIYFDPPYTVTHNNNGFIRYNDRLFSWSDQQRLATVAIRLARAGCTVVVTNADHQPVRRLYEGFRTSRITRMSSMAATVDHRRSVSELILYRRSKT